MNVYRYLQQTFRTIEVKDLNEEYHVVRFKTGLRDNHGMKQAQASAGFAVRKDLNLDYSSLTKPGVFVSPESLAGTRYDYLPNPTVRDYLLYPKRGLSLEHDLWENPEVSPEKLYTRWPQDPDFLVNSKGTIYPHVLTLTFEGKTCDIEHVRERIFGNSRDYAVRQILQQQHGMGNETLEVQIHFSPGGWMTYVQNVVQAKKIPGDVLRQGPVFLWVEALQKGSEFDLWSNRPDLHPLGLGDLKIT